MGVNQLCSKNSEHLRSNVKQNVALTDKKINFRK